MRFDVLVKHFEAIGARVKFVEFTDLMGRPVHDSDEYRIDIKTDRRGEYFELALADKAPEFEVLQTVPKERHLLLYARDGRRFLCGHDERHWFVAAIGDRVSTVRAAKESLLPSALEEKIRKARRDIINKRRNEVFKRQGEWFFVPTDKQFNKTVILKDEPLQRTPRSKPHICEELVRLGGELVYVFRDRTYTPEEYARLSKEDIFLAKYARRMVMNPDVYVRGYVRHADHATIRLEGWHRAYINAEVMIPEQTRVVYLD